MSLFEEKPRWPDAPPICLEENLPAFESIVALKAFQAKNGESDIKRGPPWVCRACGLLHFDSQAMKYSQMVKGL